MNIDVDIIILTINKGESLLPLFNKLKTQSLTPKNIILINTLKDEYEKTYDFSVCFYNSNIGFVEKKITKDNFKHGKTRNYAASLSNSKYIVFMTDDAIPYDDYLLEKLVVGIEKDEKVVMSFARQIAKDDARYTEKLTRIFNYPLESYTRNLKTADTYHIKNYFASNVCCIYDRKIFEEYGGFDTRVTFNEDELYAYKIMYNGYSLFYNADAKVYHSHNIGFIEQYKRNALLGASQSYHNEIFKDLDSEGEGIKLVKFITIECLKKGKVFSLIRFYIECLFRYAGYKKGKKSSI